MEVEKKGAERKFEEDEGCRRQTCGRSVHKVAEGKYNEEERRKRV